MNENEILLNSITRIELDEQNKVKSLKGKLKAGDLQKHDIIVIDNNKTLFENLEIRKI